MSARAPDDLSDSRAHAKARAFFGHSCTRERPGVFRGLELRAHAKGRAFFGVLGRFSCTHEIPAVFQKSLILRENFENSTISCVECLGVLARETSIFASTISVGPRYLVDPASGDMLR